jgi:lipoprotein NlpI
LIVFKYNARMVLAAILGGLLLAQDPAAALASSAARHEANGEHALAIADFDRVLKLRPDWVEVYNHRGTEHFKLGHIRQAIADFDRAIKLDPAQAPYHWQRGIALYYAGRYEDGRKQFELHQTVNGNDVENAAWRYLCMARAKGVKAARAALMPIEQDARVPMMEIHALYKGTATVDDVLAAAGAMSDRLFYAHLYIGLWYEAAGDTERAREHITRRRAAGESLHGRCRARPSAVDAVGSMS